MCSVIVRTADAERLALYAYATAPESSAYVAIMRLFVGALLAEWSAHDLAERGLDLPVDVIDQRLRYLEQHGNLLASPREVRVTSIAEYQRQPARYAATSLGVRVHRQVEEVLAAAGGAREVPREAVGGSRPSAHGPGPDVAGRAGRYRPGRHGRDGVNRLPPVRDLRRSGHRLLQLRRLRARPGRPRRRGVAGVQAPPARLPGDDRRERHPPQRRHPVGARPPRTQRRPGGRAGGRRRSSRSRPCERPAPEAKGSSGRGAARSPIGPSCEVGSARPATARQGPNSCGRPR